MVRGSRGILDEIRAIIRRVPRGRVVTYGDAARAVGLTRAARLTVWALQKGAGLPWHRVVAKGGRIALAGADGREQRRRLASEGITFAFGRVRMERHAWSPSRRTIGRRVPPTR